MKPTTKPQDCPNCQANTVFHFAGEQQYPPHVAQKAGFSTHHFEVWTCDTCQTTLLEPKHVLETVDQ